MFEMEVRTDERSQPGGRYALREDGWPANSEINIMEYYRKKLLANIACIGIDGKAEWYSNRFSTDSLGGKNWASKLHI